MKSLVILAGGKSSRMGQDKVLLEFAGRTFVEHIFFSARKYFDRVIISTDTDSHAQKIRSLPLFREMHHMGADQGSVMPEIVTDRYSEAGPVGGIRSVFEATDVERFSIISVDVPKADMRVLSALYDRCEKKAVYLKMGEKKAEPLIAAYDRSAYEDIKNALDGGIYKVRLAIPDNDSDIITDRELALKVPELAGLDFEEAFRNYNTPQEYDILATGYNE